MLNVVRTRVVVCVMFARLIIHLQIPFGIPIRPVPGLPRDSLARATERACPVLPATSVKHRACFDLFRDRSSEIEAALNMCGRCRQSSVRFRPSLDWVRFDWLVRILCWGSNEKESEAFRGGPVLQAPPSIVRRPLPDWMRS